jgi:multidrug efflux pump subunit AcrA (membrane-fusion protein)
MNPPYALHVLTAAALAAPGLTHAQAQPLDCMIQPSQVVLIGSAIPGVVDHIAVERGDMVTRGQVLVQLQAHVERAALAVARERASQVGEAMVARSAQELARSELERARAMYTQEFVSKAYLEKQTAEAQGAGGRSMSQFFAKVVEATKAREAKAAARLTHGHVVAVYDQGDDNPTRAAFYSTFVGRSAAQVKAAWAQLVFSGKATPPKVVDGDAEVKKAVAANKLAVGYIKPSSVDDTVKVLLK